MTEPTATTTTRTWDIGSPEPEGVGSVNDYTHPTDPEDHDSANWGRTYSGDWKGYKNGNGVYLNWAELVRRWGPVTARDVSTGLG